MRPVHPSPLPGRVLRSPSDFVSLPVPFLDKGRTLEGCDCFGLYVLANLHLLGRSIPSFGECYETVDDHAALARLILQRRDTDWNKLEPGSQLFGDGVLLKLAGRPIHCGFVIDRSRMLHIEVGVNASIERYDGLRWKRNVIGFYRHVSVPQP